MGNSSNKSRQKEKGESKEEVSMELEKQFLDVSFFSPHQTDQSLIDSGIHSRFDNIYEKLRISVKRKLDEHIEISKNKLKITKGFPQKLGLFEDIHSQHLLLKMNSSQKLQTLYAPKNNEFVYLPEFFTIKIEGNDDVFFLYKGQWDKEHFPNGYGRILQLNEQGKLNSVYEGQHHLLTYQGKGFLITIDETEIYGQFKSGMLDGDGLIHKINGFYCEGQFIRGLPFGSCDEFWPRKALYTGEYVHGIKQGVGTIYYCDQFKQNPKEISEQQLIDCLEVAEIYQGQFQHNAIHGRGKYTWADGSKFVGQFQQGRMFGEGVFTWPNGVILKAKLINQLSQVKGTMVWTKQMHPQVKKPLAVNKKQHQNQDQTSQDKNQKNGQHHQEQKGDQQLTTQNINQQIEEIDDNIQSIVPKEEEKLIEILQVDGLWLNGKLQGLTTIVYKNLRYVGIWKQGAFFKWIINPQKNIYQEKKEQQILIDQPSNKINDNATETLVLEQTQEIQNNKQTKISEEPSPILIQSNIFNSDIENEHFENFKVNIPQQSDYQQLLQFNSLDNVDLSFNQEEIKHSLNQY